MDPYWKNEKAFTASVKKAAKQFGWLPYHTFNSKRSDPGFPDLVLVRGSELIFAELKMPKGRISEHQRNWAAKLTEAGQRIYLWRPADWDNILEVLR